MTLVKPQILGNEQIISRLAEGWQTDRISHAYLFEGQRGIGRYTAALYFAGMVLCKGEKAPCGTCASCRKIENGNHEHIYIAASDGSSVKDAQIEEIQSFTLKKSYDDDRTFIIIDDADTMTARAQNRILKTLEEPPANMTFILLAQNAHRMAMTITSRCVVMKFKPVDRSLIATYLQKKGAERTKAETIAALSGGLPGKAISLLNDEGVEEQRAASLKLAFLLLNGQPYYQFGANIAEIAQSKEEALDFLNILEGLCRDVMLQKAGAPKNLMINLDYLPQVTKAAAKISQCRLTNLIMGIETSKNDIAMNININYALKNLIIGT